MATPIGNLEDITLRALRVLREVDLIAAEDTRHTAKLLLHYGIQTPTTSVHEHNEVARVEGLVARLCTGDSIALVSDAGTPAVSDPGFRLVRAAITAGISVQALPGPSAVLAALTCSGLPTDAFVFVGFPPSRARARETWFEQFSDEERTIVFFEAPHRIRDSLASAARVLGDRDAAVGRELSKVHEEFIRGPLSAVLERLTEARGEFTVVLAGAPARATGEASQQASDDELLTAFRREAATGAGRREAVVTVARRHGLHARAVYAAIERARKG